MSLSSLALDSSWRDAFAAWNPTIAPLLDPLELSKCHAPRYAMVPDAQSQVIPDSGKIEYNFFLPVGSLVWGFWAAVLLESTSGDAPEIEFPEIITSEASTSFENNVINPGPAGPFDFGATTRFQILQDVTTFKLRAYKSDDEGVTWAEVDAAGAPDIADNNLPSPPPSTYEYFGVVRDASAVDSANLYAVFWAPDFTIAAVTFDMSTETWGSVISSTLTYRFPDLPVVSNGGFGVAHRAVDNTLWMMFPAGSDSGTPVANRVFGAPCDLTAATWAGSLTALGTTDDADTHQWEPVGMVPDSDGNIHCIFVAFSGTFPAPQTSFLYHQVIHTDDSLTVSDVIVPFGSANPPAFVSYPSISADDLIAFTYNLANSAVAPNVHCVRFVAADAPVYFDETPFGLIQTDPDSFPRGFYSTISLDGLDYIFYTRDPLDGNMVFAFITSAGVGLGWSAETIIGTVSAGLYSTGVNASAYPLISRWAISMGAPPSEGFEQGQAYFESLAATPIPADLVFQLTDVSLEHKFFQEPVRADLVETYGAAEGRFPGFSLLPAPHPVVGDGLFTLEAWGTPGAQIVLLLGVAEAHADCAVR